MGLTSRMNALLPGGSSGGKGGGGGHDLNTPLEF